MNELLKIFSSIIIPGIIWDILKTGTECSVEYIMGKFSLWNISNKEAKEIKQLIGDLKFKNISSKKELKKILRRSDIYNSKVSFKKRNTYKIINNGDNNNNFINYDRSYKLLIVIFLIIIIISSVAFVLHFKSKPPKVENTEFTNKYVFGTYDGLIKKNNAPTAFQKMDVEFYVNETEHEKGNYVRILHHSLHNDLSKTKWDELKDIYESILISLCSQYNNSDLKTNEEFYKSWKFMHNKKCVFIDIYDRYSDYTDWNNTLIFKHKDGFLMQKCLYFGEYDIIVVILSCCEKSYKKLKNIKGSGLLLDCFESFIQNYNENIFVRSYDTPN